MSLKSNLTPEIEMDSYNSEIYIIDSVINSRIKTIDLVKVTAVNNDGTINVIPIVQEITTAGEPIPVIEISRVRYIKWQSGINALIMTPQVGDIGLFCICKKDISNAENGIVATYRKWNYADGVYLGGINGLNQAPSTTIEINTNININGENVTINAEKANIIANEINLGGEGGQGIARIGDSVDLTTAKIITGSTVVKSL